MGSFSRAGKDHIAALDLLRLFAALGVVAFHYLYRGAAADGYMQTDYPEAAPFAFYGYMGVNLFFLISGFVIAWSAEGRQWRDFAVARFARLYPGFATCMTVSFLVMLAFADPVFPVSMAQYGANLAMFSPALGQPFMDGVYWSIILELIFYGWVALALMAGLFDRHRLALVAIWLLISALNELVLQNGALRLLLLTEFGPYFAAGVLVHHIYSRGISREAALLFVVAFALSCNTMTVGQAWMQENYGKSLSLPELIAANVAVHALLLAAVALRRAVRPSATLMVLGGLTYPLYLLHQNAGYLLIDAVAPSAGRWMALAIVVNAMLLTSYVVWRYVEVPARRRIVAALSGGEPKRSLEIRQEPA